MATETNFFRKHDENTLNGWLDLEDPCHEPVTDDSPRCWSGTSPSQSQCAAPEVGSDLEGITFGPVEADEACWRDDEIKLGEEEGRKAAADLCHMLLSRAAIAPGAGSLFACPKTQASKVRGTKK